MGCKLQSHGIYCCIYTENQQFSYASTELLFYWKITKTMNTLIIWNGLRVIFCMGLKGSCLLFSCLLYSIDGLWLTLKRWVKWICIATWHALSLSPSLSLALLIERDENRNEVLFFFDLFCLHFFVRFAIIGLPTTADNPHELRK